MTTNERPYLTPKQLAARLEVSLRTVQRWIRDGKIEYHQITAKGHIRIPMAQFDGRSYDTRRRRAT